MNDKFTEILKRAEKEISEGKFDLAGLKTAERTESRIRSMPGALISPAH